MNVYHINALAGMRLFLADASVDAIVTDPPYELGFMGKGWDSTGIAYSVELWREALRVLKPGGHLLAFSGSRTYHRMACAIEDAGFDIRDQIMWVYGSGFPKSLDVSKAIDKARTEDVEPTRVICRAVRAAMDAAGVKAKDLAPYFGGCHPRLVDHWAARDTDSQPALPTWGQWLTLRGLLDLGGALDPEVRRLNDRKGTPGTAWQTADVIGTAIGKNTREVRPGIPLQDNVPLHEFEVKAANSDAARQWDGWGTALKPAHEPICVARKPLVGTVAANVLAHGTGALNIDGCRVHSHDSAGYVYTAQRMAPGADQNKTGKTHQEGIEYQGETKDGRWPANLIHDGSDDVLAAFPSAPGQQGALTGNEPSARAGAVDQNCYGTMDRRVSAVPRREEDRSAARFFYCAKASKSDRGPGNDHPTVKPSALMQYLVRLVTPPGGHVLDPFNGSGTTALACLREGFTYTGFDLDPHYVEITRARLAAG